MAEDPYSNPHAARLALKLVGENFGDINQKLIEALIKHGTQTFADLVRTSGLPPAQLRPALLVMMQQGCVNSYFQQEPPTLRGPGPSYQLYEAAMGRILQILRTPRFLTYVRDEMNSDVAEQLVQLLLENGRLRVEQLVNAVTQRIEQQREEEGDVSEASSTELYAAFVSLVKARFVERVPPCTLPPLPKEPHRDARKKKPSLKTASEEEDATQRKQANQLLHQAYQQERFKLPPDLAELMGLDSAAAAAAAEATAGKHQGKGGAAAVAAAAVAAVAVKQEEQEEQEEEEEEEEEEPGGSKGKGAAKGKRRKLKAEDVDIEEDLPGAKKKKRRVVKAGQEFTPPPAEQPGAGGKKKAGAGGSSGKKAGQQAAAPEVAVEMRAHEVLWRVNYEEFNRRFRNEAIVDLMGQKFGAKYAAVTAGILLANSRFESKPRVELSEVLGENDIIAACRRLDPDEYTVPEPGEIGELLSDLEASSSGMLQLQGNGPTGAQYVLDIILLLSEARLQHVLAMIRDRFGPIGLRIWRALMDNGHLEQKQVADFAMLPKEEARQVLYRMVKAGYVTVQDVPRTNDHAPSRTFYTFCVNAQAASARLGAELYRAAGNVHARLAYELNQRAEVLHLIELIQTGQVAESALAARQLDVDKIKHAAGTLEGMLLRLDEQIALLNDV